MWIKLGCFYIAKFSINRIDEFIARILNDKITVNRPQCLLHILYKWREKKLQFIYYFASLQSHPKFNYIDRKQRHQLKYNRLHAHLGALLRCNETEAEWNSNKNE